MADTGRGGPAIVDITGSRQGEGGTQLVGRGAKAYFVAVGILALWVGFWGYFVPGRVDKAIPFMVPPLHSRLLGAMYLSGLVLMSEAVLARRWVEVSIVPLMTAIWTGGLLIVSLFYLEEFDFGRPQPWVWFAAYAIYPLIGLWLNRRHRLLQRGGSAPRSSLPRWARQYLRAQGGILMLVAGALLALPGLMVEVWPWPITPLLAQIYSAPLLSFGVGSVLVTLRGSWELVRVVATGILVFVAGVLVASVVHLELFSGREVADVAWFCALAVATLMLLALVARLLSSREASI